MLELFLKDHVTLKTGVMVLKIQIVIIFHNIIAFTVFFNQINAALVRIRNLFQKH